MPKDEIDPFLIGGGRGIKMNGQYKLGWVEESLVMGEAQQSEKMIGSGSSHIGSSFSHKNFLLLFWFVVVCLILIFSRLFYLQFVRGDIYRLLAETNRQRIIPIPSERGLIFDRLGVQLTQNIPNFALSVVPQDLPRDNENLNKIIQKLAEITGQDFFKIADTIEKYKYYQRDSIIIQEDIPYETALILQIKAADLPGIHIQRGSKRLYFHDESAIDINNLAIQGFNSLSHILGYVGKLSPEELKEYYEKGYLPSDSLGKTGVEKTYESYLRGVYGRKRIEVNAQGIEQAVLAEEPPTAGLHVILSIDSEMQKNLEYLIKKRLVKQGKSKVAGIVMNPQNGEILALVSLPSFDNNDFSGGIDVATYNSYLQDEDHPLFNRAISGTYPSGSVIKPAIASAALQEGVINANTSILSVGGLAVGPWFFPDWLSGGHGQTNVRKSIAWSINTFYYYIGGGYGDFVGLGVKRITDYLKKFGFGDKLGIDIPAEASGFLPSKEWKEEVKGEHWYIGDTYNLSIGQGDFLTTPLQIASMTATVANGGTLYKPHLVHGVIDSLLDEEQDFEAEVISSGFIDKNNIETVRLGMKDCTDYGSCWDLRGLSISSGGKTGTAQWSNNKNTHAWFTSFAPFDHPQIVVTILVEEGGEGSEVAEPIAGEFYKWWIENRYST